MRRSFTYSFFSPTMENLTIYLDSMTKLAIIYNDLNNSELSHCKISIERTSAALRDAQAKVQTAFHDWLLESSQTCANEEGELRPLPFTPECLLALSTIINFFEADKKQLTALLNIWIEIRSNFLASYCEPFFVAAQSFEKKTGAYTSGSHPISRAFREAVEILEVIPN